MCKASVDLSGACPGGGLALRCRTGVLALLIPVWPGWGTGEVWEKGPEQGEEQLAVPQFPPYPESPGGMWDSSSLAPAWSPRPAEGETPVHSGAWPCLCEP